MVICPFFLKKKVANKQLDDRYEYDPSVQVKESERKSFCMNLTCTTTLSTTYSLPRKILISMCM